MTRFMAWSVAGVLLVLSPVWGQGSKKEEIAKHIKNLKDKDEKARLTACKGVAEIGRLKASYAKDAVEPLTEMVRKDSSAGVRAEAAKALGAIDPEEYKDAVEALAAAVKEDKSDDVHRAAIEGLGMLGPKAKDALPVLQEQADKLKKQIDDVKDDKAKAKKIQGQLKIVTGSIRAISGGGKK